MLTCHATRHYFVGGSDSRIIMGGRFSCCSYNSGSVVTIDGGLSARSFNF
jgi:hypothetical protein